MYILHLALKIGEEVNENEQIFAVEAATNQSVTNKAIRTLAIQGLEYLDTRTEFWQQQKPMYSRRRDKKMRENANRQVSDADKCKDPTQWVLKNLEEIDDGTTPNRFCFIEKACGCYCTVCVLLVLWFLLTIKSSFIQ